MTTKAPVLFLLAVYIIFQISCSNIAVNQIILDKNIMTLNVGDEVQLSYVVFPNDASTKNISWSSTNIDILTVNSSGIVKALAIGEASIIIKDEYSNESDICVINIQGKFENISFNSRRSVLIGITEYDSISHVSNQSANDIVDVSAAIKGNDPNAMVYNLSGSVIKNDLFNILNNIALLSKNDDCFTLYFSGYSIYENGCQLLFSDMTTMSGPELKNELDKIEGTKILIFDCSYSGDMINTFKSGEATECYTISEYYLITSCSKDGFTYEADNNTIFTFYYVDGIGFTNSIINRLFDSTYDAETEYSTGFITLNEIKEYVQLNINSSTDDSNKQVVEIYPEKSNFVVTTIK